MELPNNYDAWRLDNGESSHFYCDNCGDKIRVEDHSESCDSICERCFDRLQEDE